MPKPSNPAAPALIFDCDGVLADTERFGHLPAFNQTFEEFDVPVRWTDEEYAQKLLIGGGKERMASLFTPEFIAQTGLPTDPADQAEVLARWHARKTEIYTEMVTAGVLPPRPGVARLTEEAAEAQWNLAVASTSAEPSVRAVLEHAVGPERAADFHIFAGDIVPHKKPAPDVYELTISNLGVAPQLCVVIEDSSIGLQAALAAQLACVITTSTYTEEEDFTGASLVVTSLGGPDEAPIRVLDDPLGLRPKPFVTLQHLAHCIPALAQKERGPGPRRRYG